MGTKVFVKVKKKIKIKNEQIQNIDYLSLERKYITSV